MLAWISRFGTWTLVITDIHGNVDALNAVLKTADFNDAIVLGT